jgi:hypothetical protein
MSISGDSSPRMLERYTHPTLERPIVTLETFNLYKTCSQISCNKKRQPKLPHLLRNVACQPELSIRQGGPLRQGYGGPPHAIESGGWWTAGGSNSRPPRCERTVGPAISG